MLNLDYVRNMGKVYEKKNLKAVGSFPKNNTIVKRSTSYFHNITIKKTVTMENFKNKSKSKNQPIPNPKLVVNTDVIEIDDDSLIINTSSRKTNVSNTVDNITVIDITDVSDRVYDSCETKPNKINTQDIKCDDIIDITGNTVKNPVNDVETEFDSSNDDIIDITNTSYKKNVHKIRKSVSSESSTVESESNDDVQIISCTTDEPTDPIIISDDSEEDTPQYQPTIKKTNQFLSLKKHKHSSSKSSPTHSTNTLKRKYNSPLHKRKKALTGENESGLNLGAFVIDKQRISHNLPDSNATEFRAATNQPSSSSMVTKKASKKLRPIIIDGLNIGHKHGCGTFSAKGIELCIEFFAKRGHKDVIAFIPHHRQGPPGSVSNTILNKLHKNGHICFTPSRKVNNVRMTCYDDRILLNYAHKVNGVVVSNDNYRDLYEESKEIKEIIQKRLVMVTFVRDEILVPEDQYNDRNNVVCSLTDILAFPSH